LVGGQTDVAKRLADLGAEGVGSTPAEEVPILKRQMDQIRAVIRDMKLKKIMKIGIAGTGKMGTAIATR
jgi:hypothetical protein